jgi:hypothetical protein
MSRVLVSGTSNLLSVVVTMQVKQNFERFISCKTTIDDIYVKLQHIESTSTGISTEILYSAIQQVRRMLVWLAQEQTLYRCICFV